MELITNDIQMETIEVRREHRQGREYLVVPVVAARESVMNGRLVLREELAKSALSLNGRPITIDHPQDNTGHVPANRPDVAAVGKVFDARMDGKALKANAWFDVELLRQAGNAGKRVMQAITDKQVIEVSLGWFSDMVAQAGEFANNVYNEIVSNISHDHLAVLLDTPGACSVADGCGLVRNEDEEVKNAAGIVEKVLTALGISQISKEIKPMADQPDTQEPVVNNDNSAILAAIADLQKSFDTKVQELDGRIDGIIANQAKVEKAPIVARLVANERCPLEEESLLAMSACDLKKLEASYKPADYSGNVGSFFANVNADGEFKYVEVDNG